MTAFAARLRPHWNSVVGQAAEVAGRVAGAAARLAPSLPGVLGPLLIAYGLAEVYRPLGFIALGGFLLLLDRRMP